MRKMSVGAILATLLSVQGLVFGQGTNGTSVNLTTLDKLLADLPGFTNYAIEPYATYAPKAPQHYGGGLLAIWNVNAQSDSLVKAGIGLGLDWLGNLSLVSANAQISTPFHPWPSKFPTLLISPFALAGVGTAYSGAGNFNGSASTIVDTGGYIQFGRAAGGQFNVGVCWGRWNGVGEYDVARYHFFAGWSHGF